MLRGVLAGSIAWMVVIVAFVAYDLLAARKERSAMVSTGIPHIIRRALDGVSIARNDFATAVNRYEAAVRAIDSSVSSPAANPSTSTTTATSGLSDDADEVVTSDVDHIFAAPPNDLLQLEVDKGSARERLLDAQRLFDSVNPGHEPDAPHDLWMGSGFMRGWQLGPIGFERAFVRLDHLLDPNCFAVWEIKRPRFGFGLGYERQRLALFCLRTSTGQLTTLLGRAFSGVEVAFRPGISPTRTWRRLRRDPLARKANRALLKRHELGHLIAGPESSQREIVTRAFEAELGQSIASLSALPPGPGLLSIHTKGPSLSFGVWSGPAPSVAVLGSSGHDSWDAPA